mmetsp:Transcript_14681/g.29656  ORF Transcript_14681/g.29656 Transcript_14681/m.29656 type:complete len:99 (+) Transcript_14681:773-1069(+)
MRERADRMHECSKIDRPAGLTPQDRKRERDSVSPSKPEWLHDSMHPCTLPLSPCPCLSLKAGGGQGGEAQPIFFIHFDESFAIHGQRETLKAINGALP